LASNTQIAERAPKLSLVPVPSLASQFSASPSLSSLILQQCGRKLLNHLHW